MMDFSDRTKFFNELNKKIETFSNCGLHSVHVVWESFTKDLELREGYFPNYTEARLFAESMTKQYSNMEIVHSVYLDGVLM